MDYVAFSFSLLSCMFYVVLTLQKLILVYVICKDSMADIEELDNLEEFENLTNCSVDETDELHQQIELKVGMNLMR